MVTCTNIFPRKRVLIADDNQEMRRTITDLIEHAYTLAGSVDNGLSLVEAALELRPDIGIVDISMPVMNGLEAVHEIRRRGYRMDTIFLTVNEDPDFVRAAFETGAMGYVVKRQMASDLLPAIEAVSNGERFLSSCCQFETKRY
jgi:DNA-binding NarL/FixJ family response regulator